MTTNKVADAVGSAIIAIMSIPAIVLMAPLSLAGWIASKLSRK